METSENLLFKAYHSLIICSFLNTCIWNCSNIHLRSFTCGSPVNRPVSQWLNDAVKNLVIKSVTKSTQRIN